MLKDYVAFDIETTGLDAENDFIIEIGALKVRDGKVIDRFMEFVKPPVVISKRITEITGITNEMVQGARDTKDIICDFVTFCSEDVLLGHNIMFDYKFMKIHASRFGLPFEKRGIDTLKIARKVHKELESKSLGTLCDHYHIVNQAAHRAYHDALATAKLYHMMAHDFEKQEPEIFEPAPLQYRPKKVQPCTAKQIQYLRALCDYHNLPYQKGAETLSRSEASKRIDYIIGTYGLMRTE